MKKYLSSFEKNLDEHFEKEYKSLMNHHVEPSWRTPVTKEWSNEMKDEKNKVEALQWFRWSYEMSKLWTPDKKYE